MRVVSEGYHALFFPEASIIQLKQSAFSTRSPLDSVTPAAELVYLSLQSMLTSKVKLCSGSIPYRRMSFSRVTLGSSGSCSRIWSILITCCGSALAGTDAESQSSRGGRLGSGINLGRKETGPDFEVFGLNTKIKKQNPTINIKVSGFRGHVICKYLLMSHNINSPYSPGTNFCTSVNYSSKPTSPLHAYELVMREKGTTQGSLWTRYVFIKIQAGKNRSK